MAAHADSLQKEYEADAVLHIERDRDQLGKGIGPARIYVGKLRAGEPGPPFCFDVEDQELGGVKLVYLGETTTERSEPQRPSPARDRILAVLPISGSISVPDLVAATGLSDGTVRNALTVLNREGRARAISRGHWQNWQRLSSSSFTDRTSDNDDNAEGATFGDEF
jgi:hypothetical protein